MKNMLGHKLPHHYSTDQFYKGEFIKIAEGPLAGCEGEIVNDFCRETESNY
ncbi:MAG: hypothetical protein GY834_03680 [Bacteroidetes bacterium]|nr:hypothetical protein [Bacteroidota bacterium]